MKKLRVVLLLVSLCGVVGSARAEVSDPQSQWAAAVKVYVDAATEELRALRGTVDEQVAKIEDESAKKRFDDVLAKVSDCEKLLVELKKAGPRDFDLVKAKYEKARTEATKALDKANKSA